MLLSDQLNPLLEVFAKLPQKKIAKTISVLMLAYIAYLCAQFTWFFSSQTVYSTANKVLVSEKEKSSYQINITSIQALNLFGKYNQKIDQQAVEIKDAPETRLNLTLSGVVATRHANIGAAIIENAGKQETYSVGDIIIGTRATLEQVLRDRVLIKQAGRLETLMLDGFEYKKIAASQINSRKLEPGMIMNSPKQNDKLQLDQRKNKDLKEKMAELKKDLADNPAKITDYLRISPQREAGKTIGYNLMPGKDDEFFNVSGLKAGDVAIQMNGFELSDPAQATQALKALREDTEVSLTIDRHGDIMEILFSINK